ncbi:hypothetical protein D1BOALGB6SA_9233 [Olavius sp. associated proteobacterium Delta 1]|nr:hypothetical protein D1BOALGB6SA_9233 [Olavius sp. associated proteobacterium Delta 1]
MDVLAIHKFLSAFGNLQFRINSQQIVNILKYLNSFCYRQDKKTVWYGTSGIGKNGRKRLI